MIDADSRYRSRKFIIALSSFIAACLLAGYAMVCHADDASGAALVFAAWGTADAAILKLYCDANLKDGDA